MIDLLIEVQIHLVATLSVMGYVLCCIQEKVEKINKIKETK